MSSIAAVTTLPEPAARADVPAPVRSLQRVLARVGYEVVNIDLDVIANRASVELKRVDGRCLHFSVDSLGRASLNRDYQEYETVNEYGFPCVRIRTRFLGRSSTKGARAGLRMLCAYIADNPAPNRKALAASDVRNAFRPLMSLRITTST